jgi:hypothetical protein
MEDYIEKIKQLPDDRLRALIEVYRKTIAQLNEQYRQTVQVAMLTIAEYTREEIEKKQAELEIIEKILQDRH